MHTNRELVSCSADQRIYDEALLGNSTYVTGGASPLTIWGPKLLALMLGICAMGSMQTATYAATFQNVTDTCDNPRERLPSLSAIQDPSWPDGIAPDMPAGNATVRVVLDAGAHVRHVDLAISSGDPILDWDALQVAAAARFDLGTGECGANGGSYLFLVDAQ